MSNAKSEALKKAAKGKKKGKHGFIKGEKENGEDDNEEKDEK
jgi:hypothetical protein